MGVLLTGGRIDTDLDDGRPGGRFCGLVIEDGLTGACLTPLGGLFEPVGVLDGTIDGNFGVAPLLGGLADLPLVGRADRLLGLESVQESTSSGVLQSWRPVGGIEYLSYFSVFARELGRGTAISGSLGVELRNVFTAEGTGEVLGE